MIDYEKNKRNTGVYQFRNIVNNQVYIGSASSKFYLRKNYHYNALEKGIHFNTYLQKAYNKYGKNKFIFEIIELCPPHICEEREQFYLNTTEFKYNIVMFVGRGRKGLKSTEKQKLVASVTHKNKILSEETRKKIGLSNKGISRNKGKILSLETKEKISFANKGKTRTKEERQKISEGVKNSHTINPKLSVDDMKKLIRLRSQNFSLKNLMKIFKISKTILENVLYSRRYRERYNIEEYYKERINYKRISNNQYS